MGSLFNVRSGGKVTFELANGSKEEIEIAALEENEVLKLKNLNMQEVMKTVVHFEGVGAIADIGICRAPRKAPTQHQMGSLHQWKRMSRQLLRLSRPIVHRNNALIRSLWGTGSVPIPSVWSILDMRIDLFLQMT